MNDDDEVKKVIVDSLTIKMGKLVFVNLLADLWQGAAESRRGTYDVMTKLCNILSHLATIDLCVRHFSLLLQVVKIFLFLLFMDSRLRGCYIVGCARDVCVSCW